MSNARRTSLVKRVGEYPIYVQTKTLLHLRPTDENLPHNTRAPGQSLFDTLYKKWSEWETNRSAVIAGRFRKYTIFSFFFSISRSLGFETKWFKNGEKKKKKTWFLLNPAITAFRLVFHSDHYLCEVYAIPIHGHPCIRSKAKRFWGNA